MAGVRFEPRTSDTRPADDAIVRWATGKGLINYLPNLSHITNPPGFHLKYAFQVLIRSQYLYPGNCRPFHAIQSDIIRLAHSDESSLQNYEKFMEIPIPRTETRVQNPHPINPLPHL